MNDESQHRRAGMTSERSGFSASELEYHLPAELIAQHPPSQREDARALVVDHVAERFMDSTITQLPQFLHPGDLLVLNDTKVVPARFFGTRTTGGRVPGLFIGEESPGQWQVMLEGSRRLRVGETLVIPAITDTGAARLTLTSCEGGGVWRAEIDAADLNLHADARAEEVLGRIGRTPLPPYIRRYCVSSSIEDEDRQRYQTVYARCPGAVAAPTAGLHLTETLLDTLRTAGVYMAFVTLHVGPGTFKPIETDDLASHRMHAERYDLSESAAEAVKSCRDRGGRVVAVGTTAVRVLESAAADDRCVRSASGQTDIFIRPPYPFRVTDALLTNFHLPRSTLLALVMAFAGIDLTRRAYEHAVARRYRFFSYGDAMLIT
jgi:S-adenosylmethionine:tRNA ribosyltransferase-isomerase